MAAAGKQHVTEQLGDLRAVARDARRDGVDMRSRAIALVPSSQADIDRAWRLIEPPVVWRPDDNCGPRALVASHTVNRAFGDDPTGIVAPARMAVGIQPHTVRPIGDRYAYHGFPVMREARGDRLLALDPRSFDEPVPIERMRASLAGRAPVELWSPIQNYGFELPTYLPLLRRHSVPAVFARYERYLNDSWDAGVAAGVVRDAPVRRR